MEEGLSVAQPSSVVEYQSATNDAADYSMPDSTAVSEGGSHAVEYAPADGTNHGDASMYGQDATAVSQDATVGVTYGAQPDNGEVGTGENVASHENAAGVAAHAVGYDLMNGTAGELGNYQSVGVTENGNVSIEGVVPGAELSFEDVYSPEEERLWGMVRANSLDFNAWTALIEETEKVAENNILKIQKVYDAFVVEFPLCFGYWKKYADHEGRLDSIQKVVDVYERAVQAVTYSVDIWLHYCLFAISIYEDPEIIRRLFERGLAYVGTDYLSYPLWDEYIRYEESHQAWSHLAIIYTKILENPIQQLDRYLNCFKELATSRPLSEIRTADDPALLAASVDSDVHGVEGEVRPDDVEQSPKPVSAGLTEAEELEKYIAYREDLYKKAKEFESKIIDFETAIRRPYFHVRPLDDSELENWHNYLDFIEKEDDLNKAIKLYERCLIACSNYPEFWIRYVLYMETSGSLELANNALARATQAYVKKQPEIHLFSARFKELSGDVMGARMEYELLYSEIAPCLLEAIVKHANMEYRLGNKEEAFSTYEKFIAAEQGKEQSQILPMLVVQYSRFLYLVAGNAEKAREVLSGALNHVQHSKPLLEAVIHLESIQPSSKDVNYLDSLVEKYITPSPENPNLASTTDREDISCIFLEFLDLFGDVQSIKKADNRHTRLFSRQKRTLVSKKRQAEDLLASDNAKVHKTYTGAPSSSQSVMGAYPNAQNLWPASYGQRGPAWPQNPQAQGQQWNPGYTAQAGYSAYGYANYGHPQVPTSAPQSAAYGTYPPTYPVQAYPQQNYVQPAAAAATTTATTFPQQAPAPQQYYGSYY